MEKDQTEMDYKGILNGIIDIGEAMINYVAGIMGGAGFAVFF